MKTKVFPGIAFLVAAAFCLTAVSGRGDIPGAGTGQQAAVSNSFFRHFPRGPDSRTWQTVTVTTNEAGAQIIETNQYEELANGLCYLSGGNWIDSVAEIDPAQGGAEAVHARHHVFWANDASTPGGAVTLTSPRGDSYISSVLGLAYWDAVSGSNYMIAALTNSQGAIVGSNQIVYQNAFVGGGIGADLLYTFTIFGMEQNVVVNTQLPSPADFGLNPESTYLQVLTEFYSPPPVVDILTNLAGATEDCMVISFNDMSIGVGDAFLTGPGGAESAGIVQKQWLTLDQKQVLVEQIPYPTIAPLLAQLPEHAANFKPWKKVTRTAALKAQPRNVSTGTGAAAPMKTVKYDANKRSLIIDYTIVSGSKTSYTFLSGSTYYISAPLTLSGTNTFEGCSVLKFATNASITQSGASSRWNFQTIPYHPVIFTAKDDNSVGQTISGSTGNPKTNFFYANPALGAIGFSPAITNIRVSFASQAISFTSNSSPSVADAQFVGCSNGISPNTATVIVRNALFANVPEVFNNVKSGSIVTAESITASGCSNLITFGDTNTGSALAFTNCVFSQVTNLAGYPASAPVSNSYVPAGAYNGFYQTTNFGSAKRTSSSTPFQVAGAGSYYLAGGGNFTNAGTNVDPVLTGILAGRTTHAPTVLASALSVNTNLYPVVPRDLSGTDLGFHYYPLDWYGTNIAPNAKLAMSNGVAVALFSSLVW